VSEPKYSEYEQKCSEYEQKYSEYEQKYSEARTPSGCASQHTTHLAIRSNATVLSPTGGRTLTTLSVLATTLAWDSDGGGLNALIQVL
jgi:hypothetical protein